MDVFVLKDEDVSNALGKGGSTRMKLETASGCAARREEQRLTKKPTPEGVAY